MEIRTTHIVSIVRTWNPAFRQYRKVYQLNDHNTYVIESANGVLRNLSYEDFRQFTLNMMVTKEEYDAEEAAKK